MTNKATRQSDGHYHINGKEYKELFGSRAQVFNKTAYKTPGGLTKKNLLMNKWGRIVSAEKHRTAKKEKRLQKYGFFAKKGKFGFVKKSKGSVKKGGVKMEEEKTGGSLFPLAPTSLDKGYSGFSTAASGATGTTAASVGTTAASVGASAAANSAATTRLATTSAAATPTGARLATVARSVTNSATTATKK